jgi:hypothetical protein
MLLSQRIVLIVGLLVVAWLLHVNLCDWKINEGVLAGDDHHREICAWVTTEDAATPGSAIPKDAYTGLFTERDVGFAESFTLGVVGPLLLLLLVTCLLLGARHASRVQHGLCIKCGYDLRGLNGASARCPECGIPTPGAEQRADSAFPPAEIAS